MRHQQSPHVERGWPAGKAAPGLRALALVRGDGAELPERETLRTEVSMAKKGYWIAHVNITNPERYKDYIAANAVAFRKFDARFLVRGGDCVVAKGDMGGRRHVVIEFDSYASAKACHDSPEYQAAAKIRDEASDAHLIIIEGYQD
jgi:uncharacterized protein (DUF1330 family)